MPQPIQGIHHITVMASDPQRNVHFYSQVLGQRLVKTTVNFDDPGTYHLYYGDYAGSPGTIMTFFPWPEARRGRPGNGEVAAVAYAVASDAIPYWTERLQMHGVNTFEQQTRFGEPVLVFTDPDGLVLELVGDDASPAVPLWQDGPVPAEHALRGFYGVTIWSGDAAASGALLTESFGYQAVGREGQRVRYIAAGDAPARVVDFVERPGGGRGTMGAGTVHHVAFRTRSDAEQSEWQATVAAQGIPVTPVRDRQYFRSIYFHEPSGVLYEIATDAPGFATDEPEAALGAELKLPPWLESRRAAIAADLPPLDRSVVKG